MEKTKNLSEQLNEYNTDDEKLCGTNFAIHKNVMIWGGTIIQLSNISSISRYNHWENQEEHYFEKAEKIVSFKELRETDSLFNFAFWGAIISLILSIFQSFFGILFLVAVVWIVYTFFRRHKTFVDVPTTRTNRICHYMICITMNSAKRYDFEIKTEKFRSDVMIALYQRITEAGNNLRDIQIDLKNCNIVTDSVINGGQVLLGDENQNNIGYTDIEEEC